MDQVQDTQHLHSRAERASAEAQRTILSLASGGVGLFFFTLTNRAAPAMAAIEKVEVLVGATSFGLCVLVGILRMRSDAQRFYFFAKARESSTRVERQSYREVAHRLHRMNRLSARLQPLLFVIGIMAATLYTIGKAL